MTCSFQGFQGCLEACILHDVFVEYQTRLNMFSCKTKTGLWTVAEF